MGNYEQLKEAVKLVIKENGNQEITGKVLQNTLLSIISSVGKYSNFAGIATPGTNPGTPDQNVFYLATQKGVYVNFGGINLTDGEAVILEWNDEGWEKKVAGFATQESLDRVSKDNQTTRSDLGILVHTISENVSKGQSADLRYLTDELTTESVVKFKLTASGNSVKEYSILDFYGNSIFSQGVFEPNREYKMTPKSPFTPGVGLRWGAFIGGNSALNDGSVIFECNAQYQNNKDNFVLSENSVGTENLKNESVTNGKIADSTIDSLQKVKNVFLKNCPNSANIIRSIYIDKEDYPADIDNIENPTFSLYQILYNFGGSNLNRVAINYKSNDGNVKEFAIIDKAIKDYAGENVPFKSKSLISLNFPILGYLGYKKGEIFNVGATSQIYPFIPQMINNKGLSGEIEEIKRDVIENEDSIFKGKVNIVFSQTNVRPYDMSKEFSGIYCSDIGTGRVSKAKGGKNGYLIRVEPNTWYRIVCKNRIYGNNSFQTYSSYPIGVESNKGNTVYWTEESPEIKTKPDVHYILISVYDNKGDNGCIVERVRPITGKQLALNTIDGENLGYGFANFPLNGERLIPINAFCSNVNIGEITTGSSSYDGYGIRLLKTDKKVYIKGISQPAYGTWNFAACYNDTPRKETFIGMTPLRSDSSISPLQGTKFIIISVKKASINDDIVTVEYGNTDNTGNPLLKNKTIFSLCDSFGEGGYWQERLAELGGMKFDQSKNYNQSLPISYGGSQTGPIGDTCGMQRAKNLLTLKEKGEKIDYIFVENVNDIGLINNSGTIDDKSWFNKQEKNIPQIFNTKEEAKAYFEGNISTILSGVKQMDGTAVVMHYKTVNPAYKIQIKTKASMSGTIYVVKDGSQKYGIEVTTDMTIKDIIEAMRAYSYGPGWKDTVIADDTIVIGSSASSSVVITFDGGNTGVTANVTTTDGNADYYRLFTAESLSEWLNPLEWKEKISLYSMYKGLMEFLQKNFKDSKIYWFIPTYWSDSVDNNPYIKPDGSVDWSKYDASKINSDKLFDVQIAVSKRYSVPYLDVLHESGIGVVNISEFYPNNNVHPLRTGYDRWAETIFTMIG